MAGKKPVIDKTPEGEPEDIGKDTLFAGADDFEHDAPPTEDRGDDPDNPVVAADDDDSELQAAGDDDKEAKQDEIAADAAEQGAEGGTEGAGDDADVVVAADADAEEDDEPDEDEISNYVSKDRFNAVNERMKLAEKNLATKDAEPEADAADLAEAFDFDGKERKYMEHVTEGEFDEAMVLRNEIRAAEKAENDATVNTANAQTQARFNEQIEFNQTVATLNEEFDTFNPNHKEYDQVLVDEVVDRRDLFVARGMSLSDALAKSAKEVAKLYDIESNFERMADEEIARLEAEKGGEPLTPTTPKKVDVAKKVALKDKQPPKMDEGSIIEEGEKSALTMDDAEFEALPEATKARMRGDIV